MVVIGDVHGTYKTLQKLLKEYPSDPICLVGDLVDRGPDSVSVVDFVMDNSDRIKCVMGNHERMMIDFYTRGRFRDMVWLQNGGQKVHDAYKYKYGQNKLTTHLDFLKQLPYYIEFKDVKDEDGRYLVVSHSIITHKDIEFCVKDQSILWGRWFPPEEEDPSEGKWFNVFGHTPTDMPILTEWYANIDTGACFEGGHLCALKYPELELRMIKGPNQKPEKHP